MQFGQPAFDKLIRDYELQTVLDIGSGAGEQAAAFRAAGKVVTTIDSRPEAKPDVIGGYPNIKTLHGTPRGGPFDCIWACHVLEHQANPGWFLRACLDDLKPGGILAVVVPPYNGQTIVGHLTIWDTGTLVYAMASAGADCREVAVAVEGYNVAAIACKPIEHVEPEPIGALFGNLPLLPDWFTPPRFKSPERMNW